MYEYRIVTRYRNMFGREETFIRSEQFETLEDAQEFAANMGPRDIEIWVERREVGEWERIPEPARQR